MGEGHWRHEGGNIVQTTEIECVINVLRVLSLGGHASCGQVQHDKRVPVLHPQGLPL